MRLKFKLNIHLTVTPKGNLNMFSLLKILDFLDVAVRKGAVKTMNNPY